MSLLPTLQSPNLAGRLICLLYVTCSGQRYKFRFSVCLEANVFRTIRCGEELNSNFSALIYIWITAIIILNSLIYIYINYFNSLFDYLKIYISILILLDVVQVIIFCFCILVPQIQIAAITTTNTTSDLFHIILINKSTFYGFPSSFLIHCAHIYFHLIPFKLIWQHCGCCVHLLPTLNRF